MSKKRRTSRAEITIDLHGIIDDIVAKLRERGQIDTEAEVLRRKVPAVLVIKAPTHD